MAPELRIASPCSADWDRMVGDDRSRHCEQCNLSVYNFAELTRAEIEELVTTREGRLCARLYRRADGTMITKDCPVGFQMRVRRISRIAGVALSAAMTTISANAQSSPIPEPHSTSVVAGAALIDIKITDPSGAAISDASVTLTNQSMGSRINGHSNDRGLARFLDVPSGTYTIDITARGLKAVRVANFSAKPGQASGIDIRMDLAAEAIMGEFVSPPDIGIQASDLSKYGFQPAQEPSLQPPPSWLHKLRSKLHL